jgi:UPF0176 protein
MSENLSPAEVARRLRMERKAKRRAEMQPLIIDSGAPSIPYVVLTYYKYVDISNPEKFAADHLKWCRENGIKGRILVSKIGINGTCAAPRAQIEKYKNMCWADSRLADLWFKEDQGDQYTFTKIFVRVKEELVTLRVPGIKAENCGEHISPEQLNEMIENDPEVVLVDMRNRYEYDLGRFEKSVPLEMASFRELPQAVDQIEHLKDKKVIAYCTYGVRCETGTAYLKMRGFKKVYQLNGGIGTYGKAHPDKHWKGSLFVFDRRVAMPINAQKDVIGQCLHCDKPCDVYINCVNVSCNALFICCEACAAKMENACSESCRNQQGNSRDRNYMSMMQKRYASQREDLLSNKNI